MNFDTLSQKIRVMEETRAEKEALEETMKSLNELKDAQEREIIGAMMDIADASGLDSATQVSVVVDGRKYGVAIKSYYNIKAESRDEAFSMLRDLGMGDLIKESVDQRTLTSALAAAAEENGGSLPDEIAAIPMTVFDKTTITRRKV